jgi:hypothetical protein
MRRREELEDQIENFESVQYRMDAEGFHYCFEGYSSFEGVKDETFHDLRKTYLAAATNLENYINYKTENLKEELEGFEDQE